MLEFFVAQNGKKTNLKILFRFILLNESRDTEKPAVKTLAKKIFSQNQKKLKKSSKACSMFAKALKSKFRKN